MVVRFIALVYHHLVNLVKQVVKANKKRINCPRFGLTGPRDCSVVLIYFFFFGAP
jgi:hypothetical protein